MEDTENVIFWKSIERIGENMHRVKVKGIERPMVMRELNIESWRSFVFFDLSLEVKSSFLLDSNFKLNTEKHIYLFYEDHESFESWREKHDIFDPMSHKLRRSFLKIIR